MCTAPRGMLPRPHPAPPPQMDPADLAWLWPLPLCGFQLQLQRERISHLGFTASEQPRGRRLGYSGQHFLSGCGLFCLWKVCPPPTRQESFWSARSPSVVPRGIPGADGCAWAPTPSTPGLLVPHLTPRKYSTHVPRDGSGLPAPCAGVSTSVADTTHPSPCTDSQTAPLGPLWPPPTPQAARPSSLKHPSMLNAFRVSSVPRTKLKRGPCGLP